MQTFKALQERSFSLLWSGQTISRLGDSIFRVALAWYVLQKTGSAALMGAVFIASFVPMVLFLLVGGVAVDRFPRLSLMIISDVARGLIVGLLAVLVIEGQLEVWHIFLANIVFGLVDAFFQPAYAAIVPDVVAEPNLPSANSLTGLSQQLGGVVGPLIGSGVIALGGTSFAFALDSFSFFVSVSCLLLIRLPDRGGPKLSSQENMLQSAREGLALVFGTPWIWVTILVASLGNVTSGAVLSVGLPFLVKENLQGKVEALGLLSSMLALSSVLFTLVVGSRSRLHHRGIVIHGAWSVAGLVSIGLSLPLGLGGMALLALLGGGLGTFGNLIWLNALQELVPREKLGRVSSVDFLGSFVLLPVGYGVVGIAVEQLGAGVTFFLGGTLSALMFGLTLLVPAIRRLD